MRTIFIILPKNIGLAKKTIQETKITANTQNNRVLKPCIKEAYAEESQRQKKIKRNNVII